MKKRTAIIAALVSLLPVGQPLVIGTGAVITSAGVMLSVPEKAKAESAVFYYNRGIDKSDAGDYYGSIANYNRAIEINPRDAVAYINRGNTKRKLEDYYGAISDYKKAIEINPQKTQAYNNISFIKRKKEINDNYGSIFYATKALEINPNHSNVYLNRGVAKENIGDMKGACDDWRKASSLGNEHTPKYVRNYC